MSTRNYCRIELASNELNEVVYELQHNGLPAPDRQREERLALRRLLQHCRTLLELHTELLEYEIGNR